MAELGSLLLRRGTTAERKAFVPLKGEIIYDTDLKQVFVGDGETYGGLSVFSDALQVDQEGNIKVGDTLAIVTDENNKSKSLRLPAGDYNNRPDPNPALAGAMRWNKKDQVIEVSDGIDWKFVNTTKITTEVRELYVSLDGTDGRKHGRQRGRSWGTAFRTLNVAMREAEDIVNANQQTEPFVNEQQPYLKVQVLVHVASGIYEEHLPIRVPANTSIFGSGQRRTTVRPLAGQVSTSPWARTRFWRETAEFPNGYFGYHYLTDPRDMYSTPKDNTDIDIFLCNDTNWFHDFGTDLHNSFCFVLDPEGQILTKSPYPHTGVCFAKSSFETAPYEVGFHGGMFADGFCGNQQFNVDSIAGDNLSMVASGFWRKPNMPTAFYSDGVRYQASSVEADTSTTNPNAVALLESNKGFIQDQTIEYVNSTYLFSYNETKCRRDLQFIIKGIATDIALGTNYFGRQAALSYRRPNSAYVLSDQITQTIGALNFAKGETNTVLQSDTAIQTKNITEWNDIIDVISNGEANVDDIVWPTTVNDDDKDAAKKLIDDNITFIQNETVAWITAQSRDAIAPFTSGFNYDQAKCKRDIGFLLQALQFDLLFGGNSATSDVARSYWVGLDSQIPTQQAQHVAAFNKIKDLLVQNILTKNILTTQEKYQLDFSQIADEETPAASAARLAEVEALITIVNEVIQYGTNYLPLRQEPDYDTYLANLPPLFKDPFTAKVALKDALLTAAPTVIDSTVEFIEDTYQAFNYSEDTCRRDVGLIIDSMIFDLTFGGHSKTMAAAETYTETGLSVILNQEAETVDAIQYAKTLALDVLNNREPTTLYTYETGDSTVSTQVFDTGNPAEAGVEATVTELFGYITNYISNYTDIKQARDLLEANKAWIQDEVIAFINDQYPTFTYNEALCKRDTGLIISAISNDLFGGTRRTVEAGRSYYRGQTALGNSNVAITTQLTETLAANQYAKSLVEFVLSNTEPSITYQSVSTQTTNNLVNVSSSIRNNAAANYDIILDIMENGETQGPTALPKFKINIASATPLTGSLSGKELTMITAGNKSFVATDWTMFGNLGYGVLARNNARCELVSIFTYYCGVTYKAESGSEIRSLNGSSSNGIYGLSAEGRNPFESPIEVTSVNETVFVAQADGTDPTDNQLGDLQITIKNAVDTFGVAATLFNVMSVVVDHQGVVGEVTYEIGNFNGNVLNIRGTAQGLVAAIPDNANITIKLLQEYSVDANSDITDLLLGAALIYDNDPNTGYRILEVTPDGGVADRFKIRTIPSVNHISVVANGTANTGQADIVINAINYTTSQIIGRRLAYDGTIYRVTGFDTNTNTLTLHTNLTTAIADQAAIKLSPAPGEEGDIFTDFSIVKAGNHDMLDIGTGAYEDSNYPRELYGPPTRPKVQAQEVFEVAPGRVFFQTNDQDGNYRVGDFFRVNQGDGSVSFSASIALSNLDGLGFTRGVTINEFSPDSDMSDISDEAVPTEQAVVNYINKRFGQNQLGQAVTPIGAGVLLKDGSISATGNIDLGTNKLVNVVDPTANQDASTKAYVDSKQFTVNSLTANVDGSVTLDSDDVAEGSTNLYYTNERAQDAVATALVGGTGITKTYDDAANTITHALDFTEFDTDNIDEGSTNLYYTDTRANSAFDTRLATKDTGDLAEGTNLYYTDARARSAISMTADAGASGDGGVTYGALTGEFTYTPPTLGGLTGTTDNISEGTTNLYFTDERAQDAVADALTGGSNISVTYNDSTNQIVIATITGAQGYDLSANSTDDIPEGATNLFFTNERVDDRIANTIVGGTGIQSIYNDAGNSLTISLDFAEFTLDSISEAASTPTNKYFTNARARDALTVSDGGGDGSLVYTSSTGTFTYTGPSAAETRAHFTGSTGVDISSGAISIGQDVATTADVTFNDIQADGNVTIEGDLTVSGSQTTLTGTSVTINDEFLTLNADKADAPASETVGLEIERGSGTNVKLRWNDDGDKWELTTDGSSFSRILTEADEGTGNGIDADTLDGNEGTHYLDYDNFTNTPTINNAQISFSAGTYLGLTQADSNFTLNQAGNQLFTFNHDDTTRTDTTGTASPAFGGTITVVDGITTNAQGHVTAVNVGTITLPSEADTLDTVTGRGATTTNDISIGKLNTHVVPSGTGTIVVGGAASTTTTQGALATSVSVSAAGILTVTGSAHDLSTTSSPTFAGLTSAGNVLPDSTANNRTLGSSSQKWNNIYTTNISTGSNSVAGTIEGDWTLTTGSTMQATYADLAEIYDTDRLYPAGTIVMFGGDKEVTQTTELATTRVAGVVSSEPAFIMNTDSDGQPIALKGRVPVLIEGTVDPGSFIVSSDIPGVGVASDKYIAGAVIGKAIKAKTTNEIELHEVAVGVL